MAGSDGSSYDYLREKGVGESTWSGYDELGARDLSLGEVESALMSRSTLSSVLWEKRRRMKKGEAR